MLRTVLVLWTTRTRVRVDAPYEEEEEDEKARHSFCEDFEDEKDEPV